jgi:hypothetical protein
VSRKFHVPFVHVRRNLWLQRFVWIVVPLLAVGTACGQSGNISGIVTNISGEALAEATVVLEGTRYGTISDSGGRFTFRGVTVGRYQLIVRLVGYVQHEHTYVMVTTGGNAAITVHLHPVIIELGAVDVAVSVHQDVGSERPSVVTVSPTTAKALPGAGEDVLRSLKSVAGVSSVSEFSAQPIVRGGSPNQTLMIIDGFEVLNPYRLYGAISMFNPETVGKATLHTGGFGATYGDRLSGVMDVQTRVARADVPFSGKLITSITNSNAVAEGALPFATGSYLISVRRTYYDLVLEPFMRSAKLVSGDVVLPNFTDVHAKVEAPIARVGTISANVFTARESYRLISGANIDHGGIGKTDASSNTLVGLAWRVVPSSKVVVRTNVGWNVTGGSGFSEGLYTDPHRPDGESDRRASKYGLDYRYGYQILSVAQRVYIDGGLHSLEGGYGGDFHHMGFGWSFPGESRTAVMLSSTNQSIPTDVNAHVAYARYNAYVQDKIALGRRFAVEPGIRLDVYPSLGAKACYSPRLNLSYRITDEISVQASHGLFVQSPGMEKQDVQANRLLYTQEALHDLRPEKAMHFIAGLEWRVHPSWQLTTELYTKSYWDVIGPERLAGSIWSSAPTGKSVFLPNGWTKPVLVVADSFTSRPVNASTGIVRGIECTIARTASQSTDLVSGWMNYTYSFARQERDGISSSSPYDQRHVFNLVAQIRLADRWEMGAAFNFQSGRPYRIVRGVRPQVVLRSIGGKDIPVFQTNSRGDVLLELEYERATYSGRMTPNHSLDARVTTHPRWWGLDWSIYIDVHNLYNHANQQQVRYFLANDGSLRSEAIDALPILPSLGLSVGF